MYANTGIQNVYNMYVSTSSDRLCRGGSFRSVEWHEMTIRSVRKTMDYRNVCEMQKQWKVKVVRRINDHMVVEMDGTWLSGSSSSWVNQWTNEWMSASMNEWIIAWINQWVSHWKNEWANGSINDSMAEWINECLSDQWTNHWMREPMNEWINEGMTEWINHWIKEWENRWMNVSLNRWRINEWFQSMRKPMNK